jgi:hypothetical protein
MRDSAWGCSRCSSSNRRISARLPRLIPRLIPRAAHCFDTERCDRGRSSLCAGQSRFAERSLQKIVLERQLADLCMECLDVHRRRGRLPARSTLEHFGGILEKLILPDRDQIWVDVELVTGANPDPDLAHDHREQTLGPAEDSGGTIPAWIQSLRHNGSQVHASSASSRTVVTLAANPEAARLNYQGVRFLLRPDRFVIHYASRKSSTCTSRRIRPPSGRHSRLLNAALGIASRHVFSFMTATAAMAPPSIRGCIVSVLPRRARRSDRFRPAPSPLGPIGQDRVPGPRIHLQ